MRFASAISSTADATSAVHELLERVTEQLDPGQVNLALFFCSAHYEDDVERITGTLRQRLPRALLTGCTAEGTIGVDREIMRSCSMSLLAGCMPEVQLHPFRLDLERVQELAGPNDWKNALRLYGADHPLVIVFGDPFSFNVQGFLEGINQQLPGVPVVGGMASAGEAPGQNRLVLGSDVYTDGLVGVSLTGGVRARIVVSQGCRPIGTPFVVTCGHHNVINHLGGKPALEGLRTVVQSLSKRDTELAQQAHFLGRAINEYQERFGRGDFLINSIVGFDPQGGSIAISAPVKVGSTVQFHVRDAGSADEDLRSLLHAVAESETDPSPVGAMLFSCNGRGIRMWPQQQGHDVTVLREFCGPIPVAGFFAAGEIGPVGGKNFLHGFTASIALLSPATDSP